MTSFLETVHKVTSERRYYVGGCRVNGNTFHALGHSFDCFQTTQTATHWHHRKEGRL
jgi:hypothetical protein